MKTERKSHWKVLSSFCWFILINLRKVQSLVRMKKLIEVIPLSPITRHVSTHPNRLVSPMRIWLCRNHCLSPQQTSIQTVSGCINERDDWVIVWASSGSMVYHCYNKHSLEYLYFLIVTNFYSWSPNSVFILSSFRSNYLSIRIMHHYYTMVPFVYAAI